MNSFLSHPRISMVAGAVVLALAGTSVHAAIVVPIGAANAPVKLTFSPDWLGSLDAGRTTVAPYPYNNVAQPAVIKDPDGFYASVQIQAYITSFTADSYTDGDFGRYYGKLVGLGTSSGFALNSPVQKAVSSGGSLTVTDLDLDLANKKIYATLIGGNGVGTLNHFELWNAKDVVVSSKDLGFNYGPSLFLDSDHFVSMSGLSVTADGYNTIAKSLGLLALGKAALNGVTDYGTITVSVPEPSIYALMGTGLAGIAVAARRQRKR